MGKNNGDKKVLPVCKDNRRCFARNGEGKCTILNTTYGGKPCKFCKPRREITNGEYYPHREDIAV